MNDIVAHHAIVVEEGIVTIAILRTINIDEDHGLVTAIIKSIRTEILTEDVRGHDQDLGTAEDPGIATTTDTGGDLFRMIEKWKGNVLRHRTKKVEKVMKLTMAIARMSSMISNDGKKIRDTMMKVE